MELDTLSSSVLKLSKLEIDVTSCMMSIKQEQKRLIDLRWEQGKIISEAASGNDGYGSHFFERLEQGTGISERLLRQIKSFYESDEWQRSKVVLDAWIEHQELEQGKSPNWTHIRNLVAKRQDLADPNKREVERTNLERRAERLEKDAEIIQQTHVDLESTGVASKAFEVAQDTMRIVEFDREEAPIKPMTPRSEKYLAFIRTLPCCVTGTIQGIEAHHVFSGAMGMKETDFCAIPLSREMHAEFHRVGRLTFQKEHQISYWEIMAKCMHLFITGVEL